MEIYKNLSLEDMEGEIWKDAVGYEGLYQVSNMGRFKSLNYNHTKKPNILKQRLNVRGYLDVPLTNKHGRRTVLAHRIVAMTFIDNPMNKRTVDHINTIKSDNRVENLRWFTMAEQVNDNIITKEKTKSMLKEAGRKAGKKYHSIATEAIKKKVRCLTTLEEFNSIREASKHYNVCEGDICRCCRGKNKHCGKLPDGTKLQWEYID